MADSNKKSYKDTLNLPKTTFDMRAGLLKKEPAIQARWADTDLYARIRQARKGSPKFVLHDGPPYANGNIHIGHTLNKVLKDMVVRIKTMSGFDAPYLPGWDCHGLPIEAKVMENLQKSKVDLPPLEIRKLCHEYADGYVDKQSEQFQRLGIMGEFEDPYITMNPGYEAAVMDVFARLIEQGIVFRQRKAVHWSIENQTALAEAELEYHDRRDESVTVAFKLTDDAAADLPHGDGDDVYALIWTTTPWTLPANRAVAVHPDFNYVLARVETRQGHATVLIAEELLGKVVGKIRDAGGEEKPWLSHYEVLETLRGSELVDRKLAYHHPLDSELACPFVTADYVTLEDGTGLVHTAPGHGADDYYTGLKNGLEIACPVLDDGTFDETGPDFLQGLSVWDGNAKVIEYLQAENMLAHRETITHSYPHDWRSKGPVIFRATEQWFVAVDKPLTHGDGRSLRELAIEVCDKPAEETGGVKFVPNWGRNRLRGMLENRPDWCISRQRSWGLPIPVFYNADGQPLLTPSSVRAVAKTVAANGSDCWFTLSPAELLGDYRPADDDALDTPAAFDVATLTKGNDIFDVWFESGSSWAAVALRRDLVKELPVDMYLEGSDQHRGWFQLSLLPALGATATPPFKILLTHGFIVDAEGKKMSKSLGNAVDVQEQLEKRGADILRVWVASQDYQDDDRCSEELIAQCEDTYRKIRNTLRFCMGSIDDYEPGKHATEPAEHSVDLWMKMQTHRLIRDVRDAFDRYEFHRASRLLYQFCAVEASAVYLSAVKDRLYCEAPDSPRRRATQGVIREMLLALVKLLAPIIPHTAEEAWEHIPHRGDDWPDSIHLAALPDYDEELLEMAENLQPVNLDDATPSTDQLTAGPAWVWERLLDIRGEALVKLEALRNAGVKNPLDAEVVFKVPADKPGLHEFLHVYLGELEDLLGVGHVRLEEGQAEGDQLVGIEARDTRGVYEKCQRSWKRRPDVGSDPAYPDLSARDAKVVRQLEG